MTSTFALMKAFLHMTVREEAAMDSKDDMIAIMLAGRGWEIDDDLLVCPHGHVIELDGECPRGCVSLLIKLGLI